MSEDQRRGSISGGVIWTVVGTGIPPLATLMVAPILAHALGVNGRGEFAAGVGPYLLAIVAATLGLPEAVTFMVSKSSNRSKGILWTALLATLGLGVAVSLALLWCRELLASGNETVARAVFAGAICTTPMLLVGILRGAAAGKQKWRVIAIERCVGAVSRLILIVTLAWIGELTVVSATIAFCGGPILGGIAYFGIRMSGAEPHGMGRQVGPLLGYGSRVWIGSIAGVLLMRVDQVVMTPLAGVYELGLYAVAVNIAEVPLIVSNALREVMFSVDSSDRNDKRVGVSARIALLLSFAVALAVSGSMFVWIPIVFGAEFLEATSSAIVLSVAVVVGTAGSIAGAGLGARDLPGRRSTALAVACVINIGLLVLLAPTFGAVGAALATLAGNVVSSNLNIFFFCRMSTLRWRDFYLVNGSDVSVIARRFAANGFLRKT